MTNLKNKRLSQQDRTALQSFAHKQVLATEDNAALDAAYEAASEAIAAAVRALNPPAEMKVLAKYKLADVDLCVPVSSGGGDFDQFNFRKDDKRAPLRPYSRRVGGYSSRAPILMDDATHAAHREFAAQSKAAEASRKARLSDFYALISGTPSFNALVAVWPAAEEMREKIVGANTALAVLSTEVIDRLKDDPAFAQAA